MTIVVDKKGEIISSKGTNLLHKALNKSEGFCYNIFEIFKKAGMSSFDVKHIQNEMNNFKILGCTMNIKNNKRNVLISFFTEPFMESNIKFNIQSIKTVKSF